MAKYIVRIVNDAPQWITVHPNGKGTKGTPVLIEGRTGEVLGGMGGRFNGKNIKQVNKAAQKAEAAKKAATTAKETAATATGGKSSGSKRPKKTIDFSRPDKIKKENILQNRDRSTRGSILQMKNIAKKPEYSMMAPGREFGSGTPVVAYGDYKPELLGNVTTVVAPDGSKYKMQYAVVDADSVLTSNDINGGRTAEYYSDDSSKIRAIAGNGRMTAMKEAYKTGAAKDYKSELMDDDMHGIDPDVIGSMKAPVLVRVMQASDVTADIGDRSNIQGGLRMTAVEEANNDGKRVDFSKIKTYDDGSPTLETLKEFIGSMPISEQGNMLDANGAPTRQAAERFDAAVFAKAYDNDGLTRLYAQALEPDSKNIIRALSEAATSMQKLSKVGKQYDIRYLVARAAERAINAARSGVSLREEAVQTSFIGKRDDDDATSAIVQLFADNPRAPMKVAEKLRKAADLCYEEATKEGFDLFGEVEKMPMTAVVKRALMLDAQNKISAYWNKNGRSFFLAAFDEKPVAAFFAGLKDEINALQPKKE